MLRTFDRVAPGADPGQSRGELRILFVGSWVPRKCGIATFTQDLRDAVTSADTGASCAVIAIDEAGADRSYDEAVIARIRQGERDSYRDAAIASSMWEADVVCVQHEFGLYGIHREGGYEDHLRALLEALDVPAVITLHSVKPQPPAALRGAVRSFAEHSSALVVMTDAAAGLLQNDYGIARAVHVVPHGVHARPATGREAAKRRLGLAGRKVVSTFGLVDRRKGLEYAIEALVPLVRDHPALVYVIAGETHPNRIRGEGETYRESLEARAQQLGLEAHVRFVHEYLTLEGIGELLSATEVYVTPYLDPHQVSSGTLAYALGAGRAIVSTRYLHAVEALADGRGLVVDFRRADQLAVAIGRILEDPPLRRQMESRARAYSAGSRWPAVGARMAALLRSVATESATQPRSA